MKEVIRGVRLHRTDDRLVIYFELHDGTDIIRSEERLLKDLDHDPDPAPYDQLVLKADLLKRYRERLGDDTIFTTYMMYHASNCGAKKTIVMKNGDIVILGRKANLEAFKRWQIEERVRDK